VRPRGDHQYWFARAAEKAWNQHLLDRMAPQMQEKGFVQFDLRGQDWVRVGWRFLEFFSNGNHERCDADELKSVELNGGVFTVTHRNVVRFSRRGKYSFNYRDIANGDAFLLAVERSLGVPIQTPKNPA